MTNENTTWTNARALAAAVEIARNANANPALIEKLAHMTETANKPRKTGSKAPTKEQLQTLAMVDEVVAKMNENPTDPVTTAWVMANINYVTSSQKATAVMKKAIELGKIAKGDIIKGKVTYVLA